MGRLAEFEAPIRAEGADVEIPARALAGDPRHERDDQAIRLEHELADARAASSAAKRKQTELEQALDLARGEIAALKRSISWRITAPLRAATEVYRSLRQKVRYLWRDPVDSSGGVADAQTPPAVDGITQAERFDRDGFLAPVDS